MHVCTCVPLREGVPLCVAACCRCVYVCVCVGVRVSWLSRYGVCRWDTVRDMIKFSVCFAAASNTCARVAAPQPLIEHAHSMSSPSCCSKTVHPLPPNVTTHTLAHTPDPPHNTTHAYCTLTLPLTHPLHIHTHTHPQSLSRSQVYCQQLYARLCKEGVSDNTWVRV
jgi:hypothetical protein